MSGIFHSTISVNIDGIQEVEIDEKLAPLVSHLLSVGIEPIASCQNYGEYLRMFEDMDHAPFADKNYGYIEFETLDGALGFVNLIKERVGPIDPLAFRLMHQATPDAWEVRYILERGDFWVMFPESDIAEIEKVLGLGG